TPPRRAAPTGGPPPPPPPPLRLAGGGRRGRRGLRGRARRLIPQADPFRYTAPAERRGGGAAGAGAGALGGGIIGGVVAATVYAGFLGLRLTRLDLLRFEGGLLVRDRSSMVYIYGVTVQVVAGALLALVYLQVFKGIESATFVGWGALLGLAQGVLAVLLLPVLGLVTRNGGAR